MDENGNNIQLLLRSGGVVTGYHYAVSGNYVILYSKEIINEKIIITQVMYEMGGITKIISSHDVERHDEIPKQLLTEQEESKN